MVLLRSTAIFVTLACFVCNNNSTREPRTHFHQSDIQFNFFLLLLLFQNVFVETIPEPEPWAAPDAYFADAFAAANPDAFVQFKKHHRNIFGILHKKAGSRSSGNRVIISRCTAATTKATTARCPTRKPKPCKCPCKPTCCLFFVTVNFSIY